MYTIIDVGCRNGPRPQWLRPDVRIIGFDPDPAECMRLAEEFKPHLFVAMALNGNRGLRTFYVTENNECGSFLKPRQDLIESHGFTAHRIIRTERIETRTLDGWCSEQDIWPDLLKLDTQGTELDIMFMGRVALEHAAVVICEVEFNPLYVDALGECQPLFGDVDEFMRAEGFELRALRDINYVRGQIWWADAHYFRPDRKAVADDLDPVTEL